MHKKDINPSGKKIKISRDVTFNERNSFYQPNQDAKSQLLTEETMETLDSPIEKTQHGSQLTYVYEKPGESQNDCMGQTQKSEIKPIEAIDCVQNYSKAPIYT